MVFASGRAYAVMCSCRGSNNLAGFCVSPIEGLSVSPTAAESFGNLLKGIMKYSVEKKYILRQIKTEKSLPSHPPRKVGGMAEENISCPSR